MKGSTIFSTSYRLAFVAALSLMFSTISIAQTLIINEVVSSNTNSLIDEYNESPDWLELYNTGDEAINLTGFGLSDNPDEIGKWIFPPMLIESDDYLVIFASGTDSDSIHTNFRFSAEGEDLIISDPSGTLIDQLYIPALPTDVSYGRLPEEESEWAYFLVPTPGAVNSTQAFDTPTPLVVYFSQPGGLYWGQVNLTLQSYFPEDTIYYSLDGSLPSASSSIASATLDIDETTVVRARLKSGGVLGEETFTQTYVIDKDTDLPVLAIAAKPSDLWDGSTGIYVNYESNREIPVHIEFFERGGQRGFAQDAGMKMFGGWSRHFPQKSFVLFARSTYGPSDFSYRIFPDLPFEQYEAFVLRNSGGDFDVTHIRDAMMQTLVKDIDVDGQAYRPTVIYLNGEYWGILNIREKLNEHYIEAHFGVLENNLDMLENNWNTIHGDRDHFDDLLNYIDTHDMTSSESYAHVKDQIDLDEYLNYMTSEIFYANVDWPGWNLKYWRPRTPDGKWRWILFDLDDGFGLGSPDNYGSPNMIDFATTTTGDVWPNPPWSTFVFRKLLENQQFVTDFTNRYADHMNSIWQSDIVINTIDNLQNEIAQEMVLHLERWDLSHNDWLWKMDRLRNFAIERPVEARSVISSVLDAGELVELDLTIEPAGSGKIQLNDNLDVWSPQWSGQYFLNVPVGVIASPNPGYRFVGWVLENDSLSTSSLEVSFQGDTSLTAIFELTGVPTSSVIINEINYHSAPEFDGGDWIELFNRSEEDINMSGWIFTDDNEEHQFVLPEGTQIPANGYVVICQDRDLFLLRFPDADPIEESFSFGLSNSGEKLHIFDVDGHTIDSLSYQDTRPWPTSPDGQGATLVLNDPFSDNAQAENWGASWDHGSPGLANHIITAIGDQDFAPPPPSFLLSQNYPNPFNPSTTFQYHLPQAVSVKLVVYDVLGQEIKTLVNKQQNAGTYTTIWDGTDNQAQKVNSGMYFYRISTNRFSQTRKMLFLK